jgi:hypothetical protein
MPVYMIKPLTWQDASTLNAESQHFRAKTACGDYDVWFSPIALKWEASGSERWQFDFDSADAAKAAAEAWYRERLASALTPSPLAEAAREAERYRFIREHCEVRLGGYNGPDYLKNATESQWYLRTESFLRGTNEPPKDIDAAIDEAIKRNSPKH